MKKVITYDELLEKIPNKYTTEEDKKAKITLEASIIDEIEVSNKINTTQTLSLIHIFGNSLYCPL